MKANKGSFSLRPSVMAVRGALVAMAVLSPAAYAARASRRPA